MRPGDGQATVRRADDAAYVRCYARSTRSAHWEVVTSWQLGYLESGPRRWWRRAARPRLPLLQLVVEPGGSIDFAHPATGFAGLEESPPAQRVLRLWADDLLSVSHGDDWTFVVELEHPIERGWLEALAPRPGGTHPRGYAAVFATYAGPTPVGRFRVADVDATTHMTLVRVEDHRV